MGPQHWWPGETPFEVCVGAILTQNTNWKNVERAIANLKSRGLLEPKRLYALPPRELAELIRPAGYFNIKTKRLRNFLKFLMDDYDGDLNRFFEGRPGPPDFDGRDCTSPLVSKGEVRLETLREKILSVKGVGPETADSILLYAGEKPVFVVDAYTRRIFLRHEMISEEAGYDEIQRYCTDHLPEEVGTFNEFHALIVNIGKNWCKSREPDCENCPWKLLLPR